MTEQLDDSAMIKLMIVGRRAPGRSRAAAHAHLLTVHGPMVVSPPADAGPMPAHYVQNHVFDGAYPAPDGAAAVERDLVTELWFESVDHMRASVQTPYYRDNLQPDEPRFVDDGSVARLIVAEHVVRDGPRGPFKLFLFDPPAGHAPAGATAIVGNIVQPGPFGPPLAGHVLEAWFDDRDAVLAALDAAGGAALALAAREYCADAIRAG